MPKKFYLDTAIWRDYFEDRGNGIRPLGEFAFRFLKNCEKHKCQVLRSELVIYELKRHYSEEQIEQTFSYFENLLVMVDISNEQRQESKDLEVERKDTHQPDILHAILARDNDAVLIARGLHFDCLRDMVKVMQPEEVTFD